MLKRGAEAGGTKLLEGPDSAGIEPFDAVDRPILLSRDGVVRDLIESSFARLISGVSEWVPIRERRLGRPTSSGKGGSSRDRFDEVGGAMPRRSAREGPMQEEGGDELKLALLPDDRMLDGETRSCDPFVG